MTYPVARMRSMTSRIFRRYALWRGSDRPTPCGPVVGSGVDDIDDSGVVVKELIEDTEDALLLWGSEDIRPLGFRPGSFYRSGDKCRPRKRSVAAYITHGLPHSEDQCVILNRTRSPTLSQFVGLEITEHDVKTASRGGHVSIQLLRVSRNRMSAQPRS
jgi:hypothetical protein